MIITHHLTVIIIIPKLTTRASHAKDPRNHFSHGSRELANKLLGNISTLYLVSENFIVSPTAEER